MGHPTGVIRSCEVMPDGSFSLRGKTCTYVKALSANTEATVTVPTFVTAAGGTNPATRAFFACNGDFWANYDITLSAIPSADIVDGTAPEFKPQVRLITDVLVIHLIAPSACLLSILFFQE